MQIYFTRHAESVEQNGEDCIDAPLSAVGRQQAIELSGHYDLVITSPLRRCLETLQESSITYDQLEVCHLFRERRRGRGSELLLEKPHMESWPELEERVKEFNKYLLSRLHTKTLLVGHGLFFHVWNKLDGPDSSENAKIIRLHSLEKF